MKTRKLVNAIACLSVVAANLMTWGGPARAADDPPPNVVLSDGGPDSTRAKLAPLDEKPAEADVPNVAPETTLDPNAPKATITVNTSLDEDTANGACSLREAIVAANTNLAYKGCPSGSALVTDTIAFAGSVTQINLVGELPEVQNRLNIVGWNGSANVKLNAAALGVGFEVFQVDTNDVSISNLQIFNGAAGGGVLIYLVSGTGHSVFFNYLGVSSSSTNCSSGGVSRSGSYAVYAGSLASNGSIFGNIIGCNAIAGIYLSGADGFDIGGGGGGTGGTVSNNVGLAGNNPIPNGTGVYLSNAAKNNVVRGNNISGNTNDGLRLNGNGTPDSNSTANNIVISNKIGTRLTGATALANGGNGIHVTNGAWNNRIGGTDDDHRNLISGNSDHGVFIEDSNLTYVLGNYIGVNITGTATVGNALSGVRIDGGLGNYVGCTLVCISRKGNRIGGNQRGVYVNGGSEHAIISNEVGWAPGFLFGTDVGNTFSGIFILGGATKTLVGSASSSERSNMIAFNNTNGISLDGAATLTTTIGINTVFANTRNGVNLANDTSGNLITGTTIALNGIAGYYAGIFEQNGTSGNVWSHLTSFGNGGLGIDINATNVPSNVVDNPHIYFSSVKKVGPNVIIIGKGPAQIVPVNTRTVEIYKVTLDASGYGEGSAYVGTATMDNDGDFTLSYPDTAAGCYTAFITRDPILSGKPYSGEFSQSSCQLRLPIAARPS